MDESPDQLVTVFMPREDARRAKAAANAVGLSRSALIRWLLSGFLDDETEQTDD